MCIRDRNKDEVGRMNFELWRIGLVIFGHDEAQWATLKLAPEYYA